MILLWCYPLQRPKDDKLARLTISGKPFYTLITLREKKLTLTLQHLGFNILCACPQSGGWCMREFEKSAKSI